MEAIIRELEMIEGKIIQENKILEMAVEDFKDSASRYDAYSIETFIPWKVREIAEHRARLEKFNEQKKMLEYLLKQQEA